MMLEPWNDPLLLQPPVNMVLCKDKFDISALQHVCNNLIKVLSNQSPLHRESALCSRFLYRYDRKFRNDIGYRNFRKVHTALKRYLALNLLKDIENFRLALPSDKDDDKYLPTRQMLEYVMLRIISFSMIMLRVCVCSKQAAVFYLNRVKRGESHWMSLLPYALLCRLWSMSMVLVQHSTTWYSNLYPYLDKLKPKGLNFLPDNYVLPHNLDEWLDLKNVNNFGRFDWDQKKLIDAGNNLLDDDDDENDLFDNILNFVNQSNKNESEEQLEEEFKSLLDQHSVTDWPNSILQTTKIDQRDLSKDNCNIDHGQVLSRESFKVLLNSQNKVIQLNNQQESSENAKQRKKDPPSVSKRGKEVPIVNKIKEINEHSNDNITDAASLKEFIKKEEKFRNGSDSRSLTIHLSLMQWHALKNTLLKLCSALTNKKIERKFQKIWKAKCLDYM